MVEKRNEINDNNKINNINNINNNISLNNRYNFYIKIGKNNKLDINKDNKDINCEIKLTSPNQGKENISSSVIKKLIVECDLDKINKKLKSNNDKKEINVNIKPLYKKIEIEKNAFSNDKYKDETLRNNKTKNYSINTTRAKSKTSRLDNKKTFKFLIHQAYKNRDLSTSFNRYYKSGQSLRGKSQIIKDNKKHNNDSFNYSNINNERINNNGYNKPLGLKYFSSEKKDYNENDENNKKYKNFYSSFRNIDRFKGRKNISYEEIYNKDEKKNNNEKNKINNITCIANNNNENKNVNNLELTPVSVSISNTNEENLNNNIMNNDINIMANKNKHIKDNMNHKMVSSLESLESQLNTPESRLFNSKINTSFSTNNSCFNSVSTTCKKNIDVNTNNKNKNIFPISTNLSISFINLEVLYVLEEKLKIILEKIKNNQRYGKECYDFINYYFIHNFYNEELRIFKFGPNRKIINNYMKIELLCYFLCYDISFIEDLKQVEILLKTILCLLHMDFLLFLSLVISQYKNKDNNIIILLNKIVKDNLSINDLNEDINNYNNIDENKYTEIIDNNSKKLIDYYKMIIEHVYKKYLEGNNTFIQFPDCLNFINPNSLNKIKIQIVISNFFIQAYKSLPEYNFDMLKKFFYLFLYFKQTSKIFDDNKIIEQSPKVIRPKTKISDSHYLLPKIKNQKYTLVLDLDETLVYCQPNTNYHIKSNNNFNDLLIYLRPGLHEFLHDMKILFELVIFTSGTPEYVDPIVKIIEKEEKYFDYILYRQHITKDENGDNIKNLNLIGRDLKNVIIIDDIAQYFKLQKENGICIRPFCGNNLADRKTLKTLNNVLKKIRLDADETKDIRISLDKYRNMLYPIVTDIN